MNLIPVVLLLLLIVGGLPTWRYHSYGWGPSGIGSIILLVGVLVHLLGAYV